MRRFIIEITKGDTETIIRDFDTLQEAKQFGSEYFLGMTRAQGILCCAAADLDASGRRTSNVEEIYQVWR